MSKKKRQHDGRTSECSTIMMGHNKRRTSLGTGSAISDGRPIPHLSVHRAYLTAIPNTFPTISDGFGPFSDGFGLFSDGFGRFWTVSDGFGPFSDGFGPFSDGFGRFRTVFGSFRIVFRRVPAVLDDSNPNFKNFKFQLATAGARPCRSVRPCRPPQPWPIEI